MPHPKKGVKCLYIARNGELDCRFPYAAGRVVEVWFEQHVEVAFAVTDFEVELAGDVAAVDKFAAAQFAGNSGRRVVDDFAVWGSHLEVASVVVLRFVVAVGNRDVDNEPACVEPVYFLTE